MSASGLMLHLDLGSRRLCGRVAFSSHPVLELGLLKSLAFHFEMKPVLEGRPLQLD